MCKNINCKIWQQKSDVVYQETDEQMYIEPGTPFYRETG